MLRTATHIRMCRTAFRWRLFLTLASACAQDPAVNRPQPAPPPTPATEQNNAANETADADFSPAPQATDSEKATDTIVPRQDVPPPLSPRNANPDKTEVPAKPAPRAKPAAAKKPQEAPKTAPIVKNGVPPIVGPVFRVPGSAAVTVARAAGYKFSPAGGGGAKNGIHTQASQFPNVVTSEVDGPRMMQMRPAAGWAIPQVSNNFFMFVDASLNPAPLAPGWKIRGIKLKGPNWIWAGQPKSGAPSASFSLTLLAFRNQLPATVVELDSLLLEGPKGATDWRQAFLLSAKP